VWTDSVVSVPRSYFNTRHHYTQNYLTVPISVPPNTFLATCGGFSLVTYSLIVNKEHIIGIIDAHKQKQRKRFGNTELFVYPYDRLTSCGKETSMLVIHPKRGNIIQQIKDTNPDIQIL
jgi:hypothetical protein